MGSMSRREEFCLVQWVDEWVGWERKADFRKMNFLFNRYVDAGVWINYYMYARVVM